MMLVAPCSASIAGGSPFAKQTAASPGVARLKESS